MRWDDFIQILKRLLVIVGVGFVWYDMIGKRSMIVNPVRSLLG